MLSLPIPNWLSVRYLLFTLLCLSVCPISGQHLEDVLATLQIEEDGDILTDDELFLLEDLVRRPLDLNRANKKQIEEIPLLTSADASLILQKRKEVGRFTSKEQIFTIQGLSTLASQLLPLVATVKQIPPTSVTLRNRWVTPGEDIRILTRGKITQSFISGGFILERDPGETGLTDFVTGYLTAKLANGIRLIVGDHQLQTGYGLLFSRSIPPIKGRGSLTGMGNLGKGLRPYRSSIEYWALRGIAVEKTDRLGQWTFSLTASPKDATVDSNRVVSISTSGLHQSPSSLARKHNLREDIALLSWQRRQGKVDNYGIVLAKDRWILDGSPPDNRSSKTYGSMFGQFDLFRLQFFGELAACSGMQPSFLGGMIIVEKNLNWISSLRHYTSGFQGPRSQPFREWSSVTLNESGVYQGLSVKLGKHRFFTYGDIYRQSSADTETGRAIHGFEIAHTWSYRWRRGQASLRWKLEEKSIDEKVQYQGESITGGSKRESWRLNSSISPTKQFRLQLQGDHTAVCQGDISFKGYGLSIKPHFIRDPFRLSLNWVGFVAENYQSRIYVWDLNFPGELRNKTFYPTGQSLACLIRLKTTGATLSARLRSTWKFSRSAKTWSKPDTEGGLQIDIAF